MKRNAMIQIMRLVFAGIIVLLHSYYLAEEPAVVGAPFLRAHTAVEFFFFVSGFYMAARACRSASEESLARETWRYVIGKFRRIFPIFLVSVLIALTLLTIKRSLSIGEMLGYATNAAFEVAMVGSGGLYFGYLNGPSWFLSSLFIGTLLLFPLCRRYKSVFTGLASPLAAILLLGWLNVRWGYLELVVYPAALLRGIADMCVGCAIYFLYESIGGKTLRGSLRTVLTAVEAVCYLSAIALMYRPHETDWDFRIMLLLIVATAITLCGVSWTVRIPYGKWCDFAGTASLLLYLNHSPVSAFLADVFPGVPYWTMFPIYLASVAACAAVCFALSKLIARAAEKGRQILT